MNKQFWKMNQADRIEYFLHRNDIMENNKIQILSFIGSMIYLFFFLIIITLLFYIAFDKTTLFPTIAALATIIKYAVILIIIVDIFTIFRKNKQLKELNKKFKIKTKYKLKEFVKKYLLK